MGSTREAEAAVAMTTLPASDWTVLHNVAWPGRRRATIGHVVVGPPGVLVVSTESWSGEVVLDHGELLHQGRSRIDALRRAVGAAAAVASVWPEMPPAPVHAMVCLTGENRPSAWLGCVTVCSTEALVPAMTALPVALSDEERRVVVGDLRWLLRGAAESRHHFPIATRASRERLSAQR
jgi:hypothetical protein